MSQQELDEIARMERRLEELKSSVASRVLAESMATPGPDFSSPQSEIDLSIQSSLGLLHDGRRHSATSRTSAPMGLQIQTMTVGPMQTSDVSLNNA